MYGFYFAQPLIPEGMLHDMYEIKMVGGYLDEEHGGQWIPGKEEKIVFKGVVLPVNDKDLIRDSGGTYTQCSEKVYTNGKTLNTGCQIYDPADQSYYTVSQELGHNSLHPMKRYLIERKEGAAVK